MKNILFLLLFFVIACQSKPNQQMAEVHTDLNTLSKIIDLPVPPDSAWYEVIKVNEFFNEEKLIIALSYPMDDFRKLKESLTPLNTTQGLIPKQDRREWIPAPLFNKFFPNPDNPDFLRLNGPSYAVENIAKGAFKDGFVYLSDGYALIIVSSK